jgi:tetratricopeptide (TPR) repeat protein
MRSYFLTEEWANSAVYSDKVLKNTQINNDLKLEAYYAKGMSNYYLKHYNDAKPSLEWVVDNTTTVKASEAQFSIAELEFQLGNLVEADGEVAKLLKMKPTYNYWVAKGLILRSRVYMQLGDLFQAEQNLKSVREHYPITDDGLLDEANELWDELMQLKGQSQKFEEEEEPIIEIDEQEGN